MHNENFHYEYLTIIAKTIQKHAEPRPYDWLVLAVAGMAIIASSLAAYFAYRLNKKQSEILEQQNKISLFKDRYETYKIFKEIDSKMLFELILHQKNEIPIYKLLTHSLIGDRKNIFTDSIINKYYEYNSHSNSHEKLLEMVILFFREKYRNIQGKISFLFSQKIEDECNCIYSDLISILEHVHSRVDDDKITPILERSIKTQDHFKKNVLPLMEHYLQIDEKNERFNLEHKLLYVNVETKEKYDCGK